MMAATVANNSGRLRRMLASATVSLYGYLLFAAWALLVAQLTLKMVEAAPQRGWIAIGALVAVAVLSQLLPLRLYSLRKFEEHGRLYRRCGVRWIRRFAGQGELIQKLAHTVDPTYRVPLAAMSHEEWMRWSRSVEGLHWGMLVWSLLPLAVAIYLGWAATAVLLFVATIVMHMYPIMLQRYTRGRLMRIARRRVKQPNLA